MNGKLLAVTLTGDPRHNRELAYRFDVDAWKVNQTYTWVNLVAETALVYSPSEVGYDVKLRPYSIVNSGCFIRDHVDVGNLSNIGHDSHIGDYSIIAGGVSMSGNVHIGEGVLIGQGVSIKPSIKIGDGAVVGTGAVVVKDVPPNTVVAGNPAKTYHKFKGVDPW